MAVVCHKTDVLLVESLSNSVACLFLFRGNNGFSFPSVFAKLFITLFTISSDFDNENTVKL